MAELLVCGAINWDVSCFVERLPMPGEEVAVRHITRVSGGTGGNVAVAAARIMGTGRVALVGALGQDSIGRQQIAALESEGILTDCIDRVAGEESGQAYIVVDRDGQNVIASYPGANARLGARYLEGARAVRHMEKCLGIVITDPPLEVLGELIHLGKQKRIPVLWDPGVLLNHDSRALLPLARGVEILFLNEAEAGALLGTADLDASVRRLRELGYRNHVVLKLGGHGAVMVDVAKGVMSEVPALPVKELGLNIVNTVGCGDAFLGVFAAYRALGANTRRSLIMASAAAGLNATRPETRGSPDQATLEDIVKRSEADGFAVRECNLS